MSPDGPRRTGAPSQLRRPSWLRKGLLDTHGAGDVRGPLGDHWEEYDQSSADASGCISSLFAGEGGEMCGFG